MSKKLKKGYKVIINDILNRLFYIFFCLILCPFLKKKILNQVKQKSNQLACQKSYRKLLIYHKVNSKVLLI